MGEMTQIKNLNSKPSELDLTVGPTYIISTNILKEPGISSFEIPRV